MEVALIIVAVALLLSVMLIWIKVDILQDTLHERGPDGQWRRPARTGGEWHCVHLAMLIDYELNPALCGFRFSPSEMVEKSRNPEPAHRCPECQRIYVMEKVR